MFHIEYQTTFSHGILAFTNLIQESISPYQNSLRAAYTFCDVPPTDQHSFVLPQSYQDISTLDVFPQNYGFFNEPSIPSPKSF